MHLNKQGELIISKSYIDNEGNLQRFKRFNIDKFKNYINTYDNCMIFTDLEDYEMENMYDLYGEFQDSFLIIIDYPGIGFINYFFIEKDDSYYLCLFNDIIEISNPNEFVDKLAWLAEYKVYKK